MIRAVRGPLLIIVLIALLLTGLWLWTRTSLPALEGSLVLPGLARTVEIVRDDAGVPHIEAESQEDVYFALGFVHAQDRLWQMEYRRLQAAGRLAELLGEAVLAEDLLIRTLGVRQAAERDLQLLSARTRGTLQAYTDGVNAFLERRSGALPLEFQLLGHAPAAWSPTDVVALHKLQAWEQSRGGSEEIFLARLAARLGKEEFARFVASGEDQDKLSLPLSPEVYEQMPLAGLQQLMGGRGRVIGGSRAWAVAGEHTVSGFPLLASERFGSLTAPAPWYLVTIRAPGLDLSGATLPGLPGVLAGRNRSVAWAVVPADLDSQDLYLERLETGAVPRSSAGRERYRTPAGWREFVTREERVRVRGADDVTIEVRETRHGPVISDLVGSDRVGQFVVALRWTGLEEGDRTLQGILDLAQAENRRELRDAARNLHENGGRLLYADTDGRIGWQQAGRQPLREAWDGRLPVPGWDDDFDWRGWTPFARLGGEQDPDSGRLVVSERATESTAELLTSLDSHTAQSFARLLAQQQDPLAGMFLPALRATIPRTQQARLAHSHLLGWQGELTVRSAAPLIFMTWYPEFVTALLADELGEELAVQAGQQPEMLLPALTSGEWCDDRRTDVSEECAEISARAFSAAVAELSERYGQQPREWPRWENSGGSYRHPVFDETLLAPLFRVAPEAAAGEAPGANGRIGPIYRAVYELSSLEEGAEGEMAMPVEDGSGYLIPTGQSGNPLSNYYRNLAERWSEVELVSTSLSAAEGGGDQRLVLEPRR